MNDLLKSSVSFRIVDDNLDPLEITGMLGIEPYKAHRKGDPNTTVTKKGKIMEFSPHRFGVWLIRSKEVETATLEEHVKSLLALLEPAKDKLAELFDRGYKMDLFCGIFANSCHQPGFDIDHSVLKKLGELNITLGVCFYS